MNELWSDKNDKRGVDKLEALGIIPKSSNNTNNSKINTTGISLWDDEEKEISTIDLADKNSSGTDISSKDPIKSKSSWFGFTQSKNKDIHANSSVKNINKESSRSDNEEIKVNKSIQKDELESEYNSLASNIAQNNNISDDENYKQLYECSLMKISTLEAMIRKLEKEIAELKANQNKIEVISLLDDASTNFSIKGETQSESILENEYEKEKLAAEERQRRAKLNAKKIAESRKKALSKRITSVNRINSSNTLKGQGETDLSNDSKDTLKLDELKFPESIVTSSTLGKKESKSSFSSDDEWDDSTPKINETDNGCIKQNPSFTSLEGKIFESDEDLEWDSSDNDEPKRPEEVSAISEEELELSLDSMILEWARGKNIVELLHTVRTVYHGPLTDLDDEWNAAYSTGTITNSHIRKAYLSIVRHCHPDKQSPQATSLIKMQAKKVFSVLSDAYNIFKDRGTI